MKQVMTRPKWLKKGKRPHCMFCGAHAGEVSIAGERPGINKATAVYYCVTCDYMYCSVCSYKTKACAPDAAVCVRCDNIMKRIGKAANTTSEGIVAKRAKPSK